MNSKPHDPPHSSGHWAIIATLLLLIAVNLSQLFRSTTTSWVVVTVNSGLLAFIARQSGLTLRQLGLGKDSVKSGLLWGAACVALIASVLFIAYLVDPKLFLDTRYHNSLKQALYTAFIFIPLHTVLVEEFAFRGVLWASIERWKGVLWATLLSSFLFGLWHIVPSLNLGESSSTASSIAGSGLAVTIVPIITAVIATTVFGSIMCWLRRRSGSLIAPIMAHWAVNGVAVFLAYLAWVR